MMIRKMLAEPRLAGIDVNDPALVESHREILASKPLTRAVFTELYSLCLRADAKYLSGHGSRIEIGAGSSFFKTVCPELVTTDIKNAPGIDMVVDAMAMPFREASVRTVFGIHCFHHLPDPAAFLDELERVLTPGGGCVLIEPYYGPLATALFRRIFTSEGFDMQQQDWRTSTTGPMAGANQALSYLVFVRDARRVRRSWPSLELVERRPITNWVRYLASGGLNFRALVPASMDPLLRTVEKALTPAARWLALHHLIVLRKRELKIDHA